MTSEMDSSFVAPAKFLLGEEVDTPVGKAIVQFWLMTEGGPKLAVSQGKTRAELPEKRFWILHILDYKDIKRA